MQSQSPQQHPPQSQQYKCRKLPPRSAPAAPPGTDQQDQSLQFQRFHQTRASQCPPQIHSERKTLVTKLPIVSYGPYSLSECSSLQTASDYEFHGRTAQD